MTTFKFKQTSFIINKSEDSFCNFEQPGLHHLDSPCLFISDLLSIGIFSHLSIFVVCCRSSSGSESDRSKVLQIFTVSFHEQARKNQGSQEGERRSRLKRPWDGQTDRQHRSDLRTQSLSSDVVYLLRVNEKLTERDRAACAASDVHFCF